MRNYKDNTIIVYTNKNNLALLEFKRYNIDTLSYIGKNGVIPLDSKTEGDGKTPIGEFNLGIVLGTHSIEELGHINFIKSRYKQINENMYWIDDTNSRYYNMLVDVSNSNIVIDWSSAEHLIDFPIEYEYLIEIKCNPNNMPKKGSAIFLHCENGKHTAGCVAINKYIMKQLITLIDNETKIIIKEDFKNIEQKRHD